MNLDDYRADIDRIDRELVEKLEERMHVAEKIAVYKKEHDLPITDELRERALLEKITDMSSPDMALYNRMLWGTLMDMSKDHQRKATQGDSDLVKTIKKALETTPKVFPAQAVVAQLDGFAAVSVIHIGNGTCIFVCGGILPRHHSSGVCAAGAVGQVFLIKGIGRHQAAFQIHGLCLHLGRHYNGRQHQRACQKTRY